MKANALEATLGSAVAELGHLSVQQLLILIAVYEAGHEGITQTAIMEKHSLNRVTVSKLLINFSAVGQEGRREAPAWVESEEDPHDRRIRVWRCTPKGRKLLKTILEAT